MVALMPFQCEKKTALNSECCTCRYRMKVAEIGLITAHICSMLYSVGFSCGQPGIPSNGRMNTSAGTSFGDVARYSCDTGYTLNGPAERICQANGQWNGSVPTCKRELAPYLQSS